MCDRLRASKPGAIELEAKYSHLGEPPGIMLIHTYTGVCIVTRLDSNHFEPYIEIAHACCAGPFMSNGVETLSCPACKHLFQRNVSPLMFRPLVSNGDELPVMLSRHMDPLDAALLGPFLVELLHTFGTLNYGTARSGAAWHKFLARKLVSRYGRLNVFEDVLGEISDEQDEEWDEEFRAANPWIK